MEITLKGEMTEKEYLDYLMRNANQLEQEIDALHSKLKNKIKRYDETRLSVHKNTDRFRLDKITFRLTKK